MADSLANLASAWEGTERARIKPLVVVRSDRPCYEVRRIAQIQGADEKPWFYDVQKYMQDREYPEDATDSEKAILRKLAAQFTLYEGMLYKRVFDGTQLRCISESEAQEVMEEVHAGECGSHMNGLSLAKKIMRQGLYWLTMETDCVHFVK